MPDAKPPRPSNPRGGRPRLPADEARSERLVTLLTISEKAAIEARAASLGVSVSDLVRSELLATGARTSSERPHSDAALAGLGRAAIAIKALTTALHPLSNNINQIARYLHTGREVTHWLEAEREALTSVNAKLRRLADDCETALRQVAKW